MLVTTYELQRQHLRAYSINTIRAWARAGLIPSARIGRKIMFDPVDVIAALKKHVEVQP